LLRRDGLHGTKNDISDELIAKGIERYDAVSANEAEVAAGAADWRKVQILVGKDKTISQHFTTER